MAGYSAVKLKWNQTCLHYAFKPRLLSSAPRTKYLQHSTHGNRNAWLFNCYCENYLLTSIWADSAFERPNWNLCTLDCAKLSTTRVLLHDKTDTDFNTSKWCTHLSRYQSHRNVYKALAWIIVEGLITVQTPFCLSVCAGAGSWSRDDAKNCFFEVCQVS